MKGPTVKVNQWTLGLAAAGAIAFAAICSMASKTDPPAQITKAASSQVEIIAQPDTLAENISPPRIAVAFQIAAAGSVADPKGAFIGKEVAFTGTQLAVGVISFVAGLDHYATVAHTSPRVLAIPIAGAV